MNEIELRTACERVSRFMDSLSPGHGPRQTTTDGVVVHVNGWGRWCAKFSTSSRTYYAFGDTLVEAFNRLVDDPTIS